MQSLTQNYEKIIAPIIRNYLPDAKIILYGSRARKDDRSGSDIDISLDVGEKIDAVILAQIIGDLQDSDLPICFDIVDFHAISESMQQEILKDGIIWQK